MELFPKRKSDYLKPTDDRMRLICNFCGRTQLNLQLKHTRK